MLKSIIPNKQRKEKIMPYIELKTTKTVSDEKAAALKTAFGKAIECFPGKSENWLMVAVEDGIRMWFRGDASDDSALVDVCLLGDVNEKGAEKMTAALCEILEKELGIPSDRVYVKYSGYKSWGWNSSNF